MVSVVGRSKLAVHVGLVPSDQARQQLIVPGLAAASIRGLVAATQRGQAQQAQQRRLGFSSANLFDPRAEIIIADGGGQLFAHSEGRVQLDGQRVGVDSHLDRALQLWREEAFGFRF